MAVVEGKFYSQEIHKQVDFVAILPVDTPDVYIQNDEKANKITKVLYLLHGYSGNEKDWLHHAPMVELANQYHMAIILPQGDNGFYVDHEATGDHYGRYIGIELVEMVKRMFGIDLDRKDTYIGGLSMGGFGALRNGLLYGDTFGGILALSSALIQDQVATMEPGEDDGFAPYGYYKTVFGDLDHVLESDKNPKINAKHLKDKETHVRLYMACGVDDFLIENNRDLHQFLESIEYEHCYVEDSGAHEWNFWNKYIQKGVAWLCGGDAKK